MTLFLQDIEKQLGGNTEFRNAFDKIHFHFYENDTQIFAVEGCINYAFLNNKPTKINKFKKNPLELNQPPKPVIKTPTEHVKRRESKLKDEEAAEIEEKKVNFDAPVSDEFENSYYSNILKSNILTVTGYLNMRSVKSKLFAAKVISEPTYKIAKIDKARQRFRCYRIRFLDSECNLLVPTNLPRLLLEDVILINDKDRLYHTREDGWYFQSFDNTICDIEVVVFNNLIEKFIKKPLIEMDKIHSKIKFEFAPDTALSPRLEFDPERLLLSKLQHVKSYNILMKVVEKLPNVFSEEQTNWWKNTLR